MGTKRLWLNSILAAALVATSLTPAGAANGAVNIDMAFLRTLEGYKERGYVPALDQSGVTICTGVDVGGKTASGLSALGLPAAIVNKLRPYIGLKRDAAQAALDKAPLKLTAAECTALDKASQKEVLNKLIRDFDARSKVKFADLPSQAQTVLYTVAHQYWDLPAKAPRFFAAATQGRWADVVKELYNFGAADQSRNTRVGRYLDTAIKTWRVAPSPTPSPRPTTTTPTPKPTTPTTPGTTPTPQPTASPEPGTGYIAPPAPTWIDTTPPPAPPTSVLPDFGNLSIDGLLDCDPAPAAPAAPKAP